MDNYPPGFDPRNLDDEEEKSFEQEDQEDEEEFGSFSDPDDILPSNEEEFESE